MAPISPRFSLRLTFALTATSSVALLALGASGCREQGESAKTEHTIEKAYAFEIERWSEVLGEDFSEAPEGTEAIARQQARRILDRLRRKQITEQPYVLGAFVPESLPFLPQGHSYLNVRWLQLDHDAKGVILLERDTKTGRTVSIQTYPVFAYEVKTARQEKTTGKPYELYQSRQIKVVLHKGHHGDIGKAVVAWQDWAKEPTVEGWPPAPVWMSLPGEERRVELALYDEDWHISNVVEVRVVED